MQDNPDPSDGYTAYFAVHIGGELAGDMDTAALLAVQFIREGLVPDCEVTDWEATRINRQITHNSPEVRETISLFINEERQ